MTGYLQALYLKVVRLMLAAKANTVTVLTYEDLIKLIQSSFSKAHEQMDPHFKEIFTY